MRDQNFIENKGAFSFFRLSLKKTTKKSELNNPLFRNVWTRQLWERYEYDKIEPLRIGGIGYRTYPYPEVSELIDIALESNIDKEVIGACRLLLSLEFIGHEYRERLISCMESKLINISEKRFSQIYDHANLMNQGNLRDVMNKTDKEINSDLIYYQGLYIRTLEIRKRLLPTIAK